MISLSMVAFAAALAGGENGPGGVNLLHTDTTPALALHCVHPGQHAAPVKSAVLFIHGATFPTRLAEGFEFAPGDSWLHHAATDGRAACGLDFSGFGASAYPEALRHAPENMPPAVTSSDAVVQIAAAITRLRKEYESARIHLVAHSWGTIPAAQFAAEHSDALGSLTLFGPVVPKNRELHNETPYAWYPLSATDRYERLKFSDVLPAGLDLLEPAVHARWAAAFAASAQPLENQPAGILRIPAGPIFDIGPMQAGVFPYDPAAIRVPVFVVYGDYDTLVDDAGAQRFLERFSASTLKWRLRLDHGTHVMHLETNRHSLYRAVNAFIATVENDR